MTEWRGTERASLGFVLRMFFALARKLLDSEIRYRYNFRLPGGALLSFGGNTPRKM